MGRTWIVSDSIHSRKNRGGPGSVTEHRLGRRALSQFREVSSRAERRADVASCTAFANPGLITCGKVCVGAMKLTVSGPVWVGGANA